ncbi:MAG: PilZ domain-containing protein [Spirochaetes bacterium]|nr:PilZ domain-containing protein [Spirochaetota bacterium]
MATPTEKKELGQKRKQGRLRVALTGRYRFSEHDDWLACSVIDVSSSGIALSGEKSFFVGDKIEVVFTLAKQTITMHVEITNLIGRKAGGRVTQISDADREHIQETLGRELLSGKIAIH